MFVVNADLQFTTLNSQPSIYKNDLSDFEQRIWPHLFLSFVMAIKHIFTLQNTLCNSIFSVIDSFGKGNLWYLITSVDLPWTFLTASVDSTQQILRIYDCNKKISNIWFFCLKLSFGKNCYVLTLIKWWWSQMTFNKLLTSYRLLYYLIYSGHLRLKYYPEGLRHDDQTYRYTLKKINI